MAQYLTSRIYAAMEATHVRLAAVSYTALNGRAPVVTFARTGSDLGAESVEVLGAPAQDSTITVRASTRLNESFALRIVIRTDAAHADGITALRRLAVLSSEVEAAFRSSTTGKPILLSEVAGLSTDVIESQAATLGVAPVVYPLDGGGYGAMAVLDIAVNAVI